MDEREPDTWRGGIRGITQMLVVPQGFTLSVTGVFAVTIGHRGFPGPAGIWLFVTGAGAAFCGVGLVSGAFRETSNRPVSITGLALANLLPAAVVPALAPAAGLATLRRYDRSALRRCRASTAQRSAG
jgi:hypothetical protein